MSKRIRKAVAGGVLFLSLLTSACAQKGVIGVAYNKAGIVKHVFKGSNADKAGVLKEDKILNTKELRGPVGTEATVRLVREGDNFVLKIIRQHIDTLEKIEEYRTW